TSRSGRSFRQAVTSRSTSSVTPPASGPPTPPAGPSSAPEASPVPGPLEVGLGRRAGRRGWWSVMARFYGLDIEMSFAISTILMSRDIWDPKLYARYAAERTRPFHDLVARIHADDPRYVVDAGCGSGALTAELARRWPHAEV